MSDAILIRNLPPAVKAALRRRASAKHSSMEAEARAILTDAVLGRVDMNFVEVWLDGLAEVEGEPLPETRRSRPRRVEFPA